MTRVLNLANLQQFTAVQFSVDAGHVGGPVIIPNAIQVVLNWSLSDGKIGHNVLYGRTAGVPAPTTTMAQAVFSAMTSGAAWTALNLRFPTNHVFTSVTLRSVHAAGGALVQSTGAAVPGTGGNLALPNELAICCTLRTANAGVANRGRIYLAGFMVGAVVAGNVIDPTIMTEINTWVGGFASILAGQGMTWVLGQPARGAYTGTTGTLHPPRAATSTPIVSATVRDNHWDSQRRRGLK